MTPEDRFQKAISLFIEQNERVANEINQLSPQVAEQLGISFDEYKKAHAGRLFGEYAASVGLDVFMLAFELTATSQTELHELKSKHYRSLAEMLGMSWEEYIVHNPHLAGY
jgi:hypothetical protein